jgi:hypothetical protein
VGARSVVELTRETEILRGKDRGKFSTEKIFYVSSRAMLAGQAQNPLAAVRLYWEIENGLHQRLDVTAKEDSSRVRNRNSLLLLGMVRRGVMGIFHAWRKKRKNKRQSTLNDFHDTMALHQHRQAAQLLRCHLP